CVITQRTDAIPLSAKVQGFFQARNKTRNSVAGSHCINSFSMAELGCYSPSFKKPCEVLRMRRKRARSEGPGAKALSEAVGIRPFSPGPLLKSPVRAKGGGVKRRNPFANLENAGSSAKRRATSLSYGNHGAVSGTVEGKHGEKKETGASLMEELLKDTKIKHERQASVSASDEELSLFEDDLLEPQISHTPLEAPKAPAEGTLSFPVDWSMKTRLLFTSPHSFSWTEHMKAHEEAQGLSAHCRGQFGSLPQNIQDPRSCTELRCGFQQALQYWQHPSFSWLSLFPRIGAERSFSGRCLPWAQDATLQQSLMSDWSVSLTSLYSLLKARLCPFFYLCSYQFTVLFKAKGLGAEGLTALLSPSTRGLREAMKAEGIEFSLPLVEQKRKSRRQSSSLDERDQAHDEELTSGTAFSDNNEDEEGEEEEEDDDECGFSWLKEMGVQDQIKKPDVISIKLRQEQSEVRLDRRPESVLLVHGSHTFTLINFLINCKSLVAVSGLQAGLPPTLLAPTPFRGATLHSLKARTVNVKTRVRSGFQDVFSLELTGPVMPHTVHSLTRLLTEAQRGEFSTAIFTHQPTAVLNVPFSNITEKPQQEQCVLEDLSGCALHQSCVHHLAVPSILGKHSLRQLNMKEGFFSWNT
ncbi:hypothetical protein DNTS_024847, partial [Danionella cerebrum]